MRSLLILISLLPLLLPSCASVPLTIDYTDPDVAGHAITASVTTSGKGIVSTGLHITRNPGGPRVAPQK